MASQLGKVILAGLGIGGLALAFSGSAGASGPRPPYKKQIHKPGSPSVPWEDVNEAICACYEAGEVEGVALVQCSLKRIYPEVPWPAQPGDHESVTATWQAFGLRVSLFMNALQKGEDPCGELEPGKDGPIVEPPPPPEIGTLDPWTDNGPGSFGIVTNGTNPTLGVRRIYSIASTATGLIRAALACKVTTGFNTFFVGRPRTGNDYGRGRMPNGKWYDTGLAFNPQNDSPQFALERRKLDTDDRLRRWIGWTTGNAVNGNPGHYFREWYPPMNLVGNTLVCTYSDPWDPRRNPPTEVLAALGWTLEEMKAEWQKWNP